MKKNINEKALTLIELMIIIAILGIVLAWALPEFEPLDRDCGPYVKKVQAKQECDMLAQSVIKFNSHEDTPVKDIYMKELKGEYLMSGVVLKDPWGNLYEHDYECGAVYSRGPDQKHAAGSGPDHTDNRDDIRILYRKK